MAYLISNLTYLLIALCDIGAFLLILEWLVHVMPGAWLNPVRRGLFEILFPLLKWSDRFLSFKWDSFDTKGLLTAILLLLTGHCAFPWLIVYSYSLRG